VLVVAPILDSVFVGDTLPQGTCSCETVTVSITTRCGDVVDQSDLGRDDQRSREGRWQIQRYGGRVRLGLGRLERGVGDRVPTARDDSPHGHDLRDAGDTITVPLVTRQKTPATTTLQFDTSATPSVYTIDTLSGLVTAHADGVVRYVAA